MANHPFRPEDYAKYLRMLALIHWSQLDERLRSRFDAEDVVQEAMTKALEKLDEFRGDSPAEFAAWLRTILARTQAAMIRRHTASIRDPALERSLQEALEKSSARLEQWLAADQSTPSQRVIREEELLRVAEALEQLPKNQRLAVVLHHLEQRPAGEIALLMGLTPKAVGGLLFRGTKRLRELLEVNPTE